MGHHLPQKNWVATVTKVYGISLGKMSLVPKLFIHWLSSL